MTTYMFHVINKDGKINTITNQPGNLIEDLLNAVSSGCGFVLQGPRGVIAYGPGTVARVGVVEEGEKANADS